MSTQYPPTTVCHNRGSYLELTAEICPQVRGSQVMSRGHCRGDHGPEYTTRLVLLIVMEVMGHRQVRLMVCNAAGLRLLEPRPEICCRGKSVKTDRDALHNTIIMLMGIVAKERPLRVIKVASEIKRDTAHTPISEVATAGSMADGRVRKMLLSTKAARLLRCEPGDRENSVVKAVEMPVRTQWC